MINNRGSVFIIVMCILLLISGMIITLYKKLDTSYITSHQSADSTQALNLAESGMEYLIWVSRKYGIPGGVGNTVTVSGTELIDTGRKWEIDCWAGKKLKFSGVDNLVPIVSNTNNSIICSQDIESLGVVNGQGYSVVFIETIIQGTYTVWYNAETGEINSEGYKK